MQFRSLIYALLALIGLAGIGLAQTGFEWVPPGGKELLSEWLGPSATADELRDVLGSERSAEEWEAVITEREPGFTDAQVKTLASYLAINAPVPEPRMPSTVEGIASLSRDGRELLLRNCMLCHTVAQPAITERSVAGWRNHMARGEHQGIRLTAKEKETLIHYLALNMPVPEEDIPEELFEPIPGY